RERARSTEVRGRTDWRRTVRAGTMGSPAAESLHVGVGADGSRLPEALLVLLGVADRWSGAAAARRGHGRARGRGIAAQGISFHRARRRQLLSRHARGSGPGEAAIRSRAV